MAQMAPALTEASASPESSRKHSLDRHCSSTVQEDLKQETAGLTLGLKLISHNGLVRLIGDNNIADITNTIKPSEQNTPIVSRLNEEIKGKTEMPNGHCDDKVETNSANMSSHSSKEEMRSSGLDLSRTTCASTAKTSAGTCNTVCEKEERGRVSLHPVANLESRNSLISQKTTLAHRRHTKLEGRARKIETRLRKLQARQLGDHVLQQLESLAEKPRLSLDSLESYVEAGDISGIGILPENKRLSNTSAELTADRVDIKLAMPGNHASRVKNNNATTVDSVIKELENISAESLNIVEGNLLGELKDFGKQSDAVNSVESWSSQFEFLESIHDSDATEGSSGEESEDEFIEPRKTKLRSKRAKNLRRQCHLEEGVIASHWSWLQSQIINVERQIRRYDDLYKGGRLRKGSVKLQACTSDVVLTKSASDIEGNGILKGLKSSVVSVSSVDVAKSWHLSENGKKDPGKEPDNHVLNGVKRSLLDSSLLNDEDVPIKRYRAVVNSNDSTDNKFCPPLPSSSSDVFPQCARTRGVYAIRKRRLVQLSQMRNTKFKPLSLFCCCAMPTTPCLICSKLSRTLPVVSPNQTMAEKVALLDDSFHPVLSFCTDIPLQLHFGALLKRGGFEKRTKPQVMRNPQIVEKKKPPVVTKTGKRRVQLAKGAAASLLSSAKLHNQKLERKRGYSVSASSKNSTRTTESKITPSDGPRKKRAAAISAAAQLQKRARSLSLPTVVSSPLTPTSTPSPTPSLGQSMPANLSSLLKKKKGSSAFDINNIVIPYSMASSTRVEKLQYKEIPTPSWRVNEVGDDEAVTKVEVEEPEEKEDEDTSEEGYVTRHGFCEEQERKRFLGLVKKKRKRTTRQSSEISNPDPPSPFSYADSQGGTPPGTPNCNTPLPTPTGVCFPSSLSVLPVSAYASSSILSPSVTYSSTSGTLPLVDKFHRSLSDSKLPQRRSSSTDRLERSLNDEEIWPPVPPWPERTFPLSDTDFSSLRLPTPLPTPASSMPASPSASSVGSPMCSPLASPASDASSDKNEWTVKLVTDQGPGSGSDSGGPPRKGIVLKLAKR